MLNKFITIILALLASTQALAHAFWLEPNVFSPRAGDMLSFTLLVGENFDGEQLVRHPGHLKQFQLVATEGDEKPSDISGRFGRSPAGYIKIPTEKSYVASYVSEFSEVVLERIKFQEYLKTEELTDLVKLPEAAGDIKIKEMYARFTKTLLVPVTQKNKAIDRKIGNELELFTAEKSLSVSGGKHLTMQWQLFFQGKPLFGRSVFLESKSKKKIAASAKTDKDGIITFTISEPGIYMVRSINIVPATSPGWDWQSYWTSTTFEIN